MSKNPVVYWHPFSPPCRGTWLVVQNMEISVDFRFLNLMEKEQFKPEFLKINPMHCVPTLDDNGYVIWESRAISTYLAESKADSGSSMYPKDPKIRGVINSLLYFDATVLNFRTREITRPILYQGKTTIDQEKVKGVVEGYDTLEWFLTGKEFLAGDSLTAADCHLLATVSTSKALGIGIDKHEKIQKWYEKCRKVVKGFEENEKHAEDYTNLVKSKLK